MNGNDLDAILSFTLEKVEKLPWINPCLWHREGDIDKDGGILVCNWDLPSRDKTFNVYAAPENLKTDYDEIAFLTYKETVARLSGLKKWHGHNGISDRSSVISALFDETYKGEWIIPFDNMFFRGRLKSLSDRFSAASVRDNQVGPMGYWSYQIGEYGGPRLAELLASRNQLWCVGESTKGLCRPVRLVEIKPS